jgi:divalent metal cation (Fe/Co/Zn/Cd) transporter
MFICHVGWEVSADVVHRLMDGVDPEIITAAEAAAAGVAGVGHAHARARWTGRTLRLEIEGWIDAETTVAEADAIGRAVADQIAQECPQARSLTWSARPA